MIKPFGHFRRLLAAGTFRASVLTLLSGTTVALALAYLARPILTRLYTPDDFGLARFFIALVGTLLPVLSFRYEDALMLPETEEEAATVLQLSGCITLLMVVLSGGLYLFREPFSAWFDEPGIADWLWLVPVALLVMRLSRLAEMWHIRQKRFRPISAAQVSQTGVMVGTRLGVGLPPIRAGAGGLIGGFVLGHLAAALLYAGVLAKSRDRRLFQGFSVQFLRAAARRYRRFPFFSMPSALLSALVTQLPILLLLPYFDRHVLGLFGLAFNTLLIPLSLVGAAVAQVFFVHAAEAHRDQTLPHLTATVHRRLVALGLFPTLAFMMAAPDVFDVVFSHVWRGAGVYLQYLAPWLFLSAVASPLTRLFDILERQRLELLTSLFMFVALAVALYLGGRSGQITTCLIFLGVSGASVRLVQLAILLHLGKVPMRNVYRTYGRYLLFATPGLVLIGVSLFSERPWITTLAVATAGVGYLLLVTWRDQLLHLDRTA